MISVCVSPTKIPKKAPELRKGFHITDLPRTFQDAVVVARRLDCVYIWIDSLCIVQDSKDDWLYEAGLMGDVYANSLCNIAATWNLSSDDGCFPERNGMDARDVIVSSNWTNHKPTTFRVVESRLWEDLINSAPLNKRAWVVQERLLAPRVLHFGRTQLAWECHELDACETYPAGLPPTQKTTHSIYKGLDPDTDGLRLQSMGDSRSAPNLHTYHLWNKIVTGYTAGELTMPSDKLVAISGVAKRMQALLQDEYLAGLWKGTLASGLLWMVNRGRQANGLPSTRAAQYRAPTWSWAALDGQVVPGRPSVERVLVSVEEAIADPHITGNPFGQLKSGRIRLRGALLQANVFLPEQPSSRAERLNVQFPSRDVTGDQWVYPDVQDEIPKPSIFCLFISVKNRYDHTQVQGLALHCIDYAKNTYQRVGLFEGQYKAPYKDLPIQYLKSIRRVSLSENADMKTVILL
ncbi:hypothetical protein G7Y79_00046g082740 [Physcia stellaris]|nr:hypothetical protein G7Y79_00046g082740 [Physcia stellaris]